MGKPAESTVNSLRQAMKEGDTVLLRSLIVAAGNTSIMEARLAYDYAIDGGDPYKILMPPDPAFVFVTDKTRWDREYFFDHVQKMMRNFSSEAFEHYLEVGRKVFPEKMKPLPAPEPAPKPAPRPAPRPPIEIPNGGHLEERGGFTFVIVGASIVGFLLLGAIVWLIDHVTKK